MRLDLMPAQQIRGCDQGGLGMRVDFPSGLSLDKIHSSIARVIGELRHALALEKMRRLDWRLIKSEHCFWLAHGMNGFRSPKKHK